MKTALAVAALSAGILTASVSASSAKVVYPGDGNLGTYDAGGGAASFAGTVKGTGKGAPTMFTDTFTFVLQAATTLSASVTNAFVNGLGLGGFTLKVGNITGITTPTTNSQTAVFPPGGQLIVFQPGKYSLTVSGYSAPTTETYGGSFIVNSVSTVPLPSTVALFGVALAGLGAAGVARRRKGAAAAV